MTYNSESVDSVKFNTHGGDPTEGVVLVRTSGERLRSPLHVHADAIHATVTNRQTLAQTNPSPVTQESITRLELLNLYEGDINFIRLDF